MKRIQRIRIGLAASALGALVSVSLAGTASAGTLQIHDPEHVLSTSDEALLRSVVDSAPFDGRLAVTSQYADSQELSRYVASLVREPNIVVVGLDTVHRHVQVHFGEGDAIARSDWPSIEHAGNDSFSRGDWEGGTAAIFQTAAHSALAHPGQQAQPAGSRGPSLFGPGLLILLLVGGLGLALLFARRRAMASGPGYGPYPNEGYGPGYGPGPGYGSGYGPGYPPPGGVGPLGGGIIGAGLGGLAGYELGKYEGGREARDREDRSSVGNDDGGNYDAGGGGSSWDDSGGGGGGFDGGGGNDGGGGGSDF
ncbi:MAG TPA: hypothetical protein VK841_04345 [Polyangiaceae bacterium]|jgi:hypothetical protein|nr:hypothetical protein [Polyangiaceae bacterium]